MDGIIEEEPPSPQEIENIKENFWRDKISLKIWWSDEAYGMNGPYDTLEEAEHDCEIYCREVLGSGSE